MKRYLLVLVLTALVLAGCGPIDASRCLDSLYINYSTQECVNVRANTAPIDTTRCYDVLYSGISSPECKKVRDAAAAQAVADAADVEIELYPDCSTCGTATSGGQVTNPDNVIQQLWDEVVP
jgi:hypothetical protein